MDAGFSPEYKATIKGIRDFLKKEVVVIGSNYKYKNCSKSSANIFKERPSKEVCLEVLRAIQSV